MGIATNAPLRLCNAVAGFLPARKGFAYSH